MQISQFYLNTKSLFWGIILCILIPSSSFLKGQSSTSARKVESLDFRLNAIVEQKDPRQQFPALIGLVSVHAERMNPFTLQFVRQSLEQVQPGAPIIPAATHFLIGDFLNVNLQQFDAALLHFKEALEQLPDTSTLAQELRMRILDRIAHLSLNNSNLEGAIQAAEACVKIAANLNIPFTHGHCLKCIGDIHRDYFNSPSGKELFYDKALSQFQESFQINLNRGDTLATLLNLFYITSIKLRRDTGYQDIENYLTSATSLITNKEKFDDFRAQITYLKARFLLKTGELSAALDTFSKAYQQFTVTRDTARLMQTKYHAGEILFLQGDPQASIVELNRAWDLSPKVASSSQLMNLHDLRYRAYKSIGELAGALQAHEAFLQARQIVDQEDQRRFIMGLETQYELKAQQLDNQQKQEELAQKSESNRKLTATSIFLAIALSLLAISLVRSRNNRNKLRNRNAIIIKQKQQLEELDDLKSRFYANISHELKTPLALIKAPLEYLKNKSSIEQDGAFFLNTALNNTKRLEQLVNELLDLSKIESGKITLKIESHELEVLTEQILESFRPYGLTKNIELVWEEGPKKDPVWVRTDKEAFQKILTNLLSNAIKFSPADSQVFINYKVDDQRAVLSVRDNGQGIYPDDLPHIFDRFHKSDHKDVHRDNSTGIGLSLSEELARLMDGKLRVESTRDEGSTFFLELPLALKASEKSPLQQAQPSPENTDTIDIFAEMEALKGKDFHILIVEDHEELQTYLRKLLEDYFCVHTASNGEEAIAMISAIDSPLALPGQSLIISDLMMPQIDGLELAQRLKQDGRYQHIPIIMLTARRDRTQRLKVLTIGVDDYLTKPFDNQELLIRIKNLVLRNRKKLSPDTPVGEARHDATKPDGIGQNYPTLDSEQINWLKDLEAYAIKHLSDSQFSVSFLSHYANMSERNLQRHIKKITGMTPSEYIKEIRLHHARELLESGEMASVKAVSKAVGFSSHEYFSNQFYQRFGRRPSTYLG